MRQKVYPGLDGLKAVNDKYGHETGDELIRASSVVLSKALRESDLICRLGGDEFLLILPECDMQQAGAIWERVLQEVDQFNRGTDAPYRISLSHGLSEYSSQRELSADELTASADNEMYREKQRKYGETSATGERGT